MKSVRYILSLFLLLTAACAPYKVVELEVLEPASFTFPHYVNQVGFINRAYHAEVVTPNPLGRSRNEMYVIDTVMSRRLFTGLRDALKESPLFDLEHVDVVNMRRYDTSGFLEPLPIDSLQKVEERYPNDALISLEYFLMRDTLDVFRGGSEGMAAELTITTLTVWRIYDLVSDTLLDMHTLRDTLRWYAREYELGKLLKLLPSTLDGIREAAYHTGFRYGIRTSPSWNTVSRYYYRSGGSKMREAAKAMSDGENREAMRIWKELAHKGRDGVAARACLNLALYYEMEDQLITALDWAIKSYRIRQKTNTQKYIEVLTRRYEDQKALSRQLQSID